LPEEAAPDPTGRIALRAVARRLVERAAGAAIAVLGRPHDQRPHTAGLAAWRPEPAGPPPFRNWRRAGRGLILWP
jgi:hypothetical protein